MVLVLLLKIIVVTKYTKNFINSQCQSAHHGLEPEGDSHVVVITSGGGGVTGQTAILAVPLGGVRFRC